MAEHKPWWARINFPRSSPASRGGSGGVSSRARPSSTDVVPAPASRSPTAGADDLMTKYFELQLALAATERKLAAQSEMSEMRHQEILHLVGSGGSPVGRSKARGRGSANRTLGSATKSRTSVPRTTPQQPWQSADPQRVAARIDRAYNLARLRRWAKEPAVTIQRAFRGWRVRTALRSQRKMPSRTAVPGSLHMCTTELLRVTSEMVDLETELLDVQAAEQHLADLSLRQLEHSVVCEEIECLQHELTIAQRRVATPPAAGPTSAAQRSKDVTTPPSAALPSPRKVSRAQNAAPIVRPVSSNSKGRTAAALASKKVERVELAAAEKAGAAAARRHQGLVNEDIEEGKRVTVETMPMVTVLEPFLQQERFGRQMITAEEAAAREVYRTSFASGAARTSVAVHRKMADLEVTLRHLADARAEVEAQVRRTAASAAETEATVLLRLQAGLVAFAVAEQSLVDEESSIRTVITTEERTEALLLECAATADFHSAEALGSVNAEIRRGEQRRDAATTRAAKRASERQEAVRVTIEHEVREEERRRALTNVVEPPAPLVYSNEPVVAVGHGTVQLLAHVMAVAHEQAQDTIAAIEAHERAALNVSVVTERCAIAERFSSALSVLVKKMKVPSPALEVAKHGAASRYFALKSQVDLRKYHLKRANTARNAAEKSLEATMAAVHRQSAVEAEGELRARQALTEERQATARMLAETNMKYQLRGKAAAAEAAALADVARLARQRRQQAEREAQQYVTAEALKLAIHLGKVKEMRRRAAAIKIQAVVRSRQTRHALRRVTMAVVAIQRVVRGHLGRCKAALLRLAAAARPSARAIQEDRAAVKIQALVRGFLTRLWFKRSRTHLEVAKTRRHIALVLHPPAQGHRHRRGPPPRAARTVASQQNKKLLPPLAASTSAAQHSSNTKQIAAKKSSTHVARLPPAAKLQRSYRGPLALR